VKNALFCCLVSLLPSLTVAFTQCSVQFEQNGTTVPISQQQAWNKVVLAKQPFTITVRPVTCDPVMASLGNSTLTQEANGLTAVVFSGSGHAYAGSDEIADILHHPSRSPIKTNLRDLSTNWADFDAYETVTKELGYAPTPVYAWGTGFPFIDGMEESKASFKRLTSQIILNSNLPNFDLPIILYLSIKRVGKPSWSGASPPWNLYLTYRIILEFRPQ
jgi:hypothetical protein